MYWRSSLFESRLDTGYPERGFLIFLSAKLGLLTLREEHRLRVFENRVLRKIFGPRRDEVTGDWRTLYNEELHSLYSSPNIIKMIKSRRMR
jgi:hypothetical protein